MLEITFFIITIVVILLLYKENIDLKSKNRHLTEQYEKLHKKHEILEHTQHNLIKVNAQTHEELKKTEVLRQENDRLKFILKQHDISY